MCASAQPCSQADCLSCPEVPHGGRRQDSYQSASGLHPHAPAHNYPVGAGTELLLVPLKIQIELLFVCLFGLIVLNTSPLPIYMLLLCTFILWCCHLNSGLVHASKHSATELYYMGVSVT